ncbi:orexin receptor type 2-like isoform X2 [Cimex lectularius]|nr:orexin receptor type 2-like isoform X2 [Cimex lectularius]
MEDEDYLDLLREHVTPTLYEWFLIGLHVIVFVVGLAGNTLVCLVVYRVPAMRTVTNYFIVNLAVADFLVILFCLPTTVVWDTTETWFFGTFLCKIILYLQTVSVAVSVLTLTFISLDRWYAICFPLKFNSTTSRAKSAILLIWIVALLCDIPELLTLHTFRLKNFNVDTVLLTQCTSAWGDETERKYNIYKMAFLYFLPLCVTSIAYFKIVSVLWKSGNIVTGQKLTGPSTISGSRRMTLLNASTEIQLRSRRKAAKMLVAVVIMFAFCYFPVHLLSILRYTMDIPQNDVTAALSMMSHWLCYANSAVNPLIYNFMSGKFRKEFRRTFSCNQSSPRHENTLRLSSYSGRYPHRTDVIPLSVTSNFDLD